MISLEQFIKEEFDSDNLIWKVNIYFRNNKNLKNGFIELAAKVKNGSKLTIDDIEDYEIKYKCKAIEFINFIYDNSDNKNNIDDIAYNMNKIISAVLNDRSNTNIMNTDIDKYIKMHKNEVIK